MKAMPSLEAAVVAEARNPFCLVFVRCCSERRQDLLDGHSRAFARRGASLKSRQPLLGHAFE